MLAKLKQTDALGFDSTLSGVLAVISAIKTCFEENFVAAVQKIG
jgi:hypothetical protein